MATDKSAKSVLIVAPAPAPEHAPSANEPGNAADQAPQASQQPTDPGQQDPMAESASSAAAKRLVARSHSMFGAKDDGGHYDRGKPANAGGQKDGEGGVKWSVPEDKSFTHRRARRGLSASRANAAAAAAQASAPPAAAPARPMSALLARKVHPMATMAMIMGSFTTDTHVAEMLSARGRDLVAETLARMAQVKKRRELELARLKAGPDLNRAASVIQVAWHEYRRRLKAERDKNGWRAMQQQRRAAQGLDDEALRRYRESEWWEDDDEFSDSEEEEGEGGEGEGGRPMSKAERRAALKARIRSQRSLGVGEGAEGEEGEGGEQEDGEGGAGGKGGRRKKKSGRGKDGKKKRSKRGGSAGPGGEDEAETTAHVDGGDGDEDDLESEEGGSSAAEEEEGEGEEGLDEQQRQARRERREAREQRRQAREARRQARRERRRQRQLADGEGEGGEEEQEGQAGGPGGAEGEDGQQEGPSGKKKKSKGRKGRSGRAGADSDGADAGADGDAAHGSAGADAGGASGGNGAGGAGGRRSAREGGAADAQLRPSVSPGVSPWTPPAGSTGCAFDDFGLPLRDGAYADDVDGGHAGGQHAGSPGRGRGDGRSSCNDAGPSRGRRDRRPSSAPPGEDGRGAAEFGDAAAGSDGGVWSGPEEDDGRRQKPKKPLPSLAELRARRGGETSAQTARRKRALAARHAQSRSRAGFTELEVVVGFAAPVPVSLALVSGQGDARNIPSLLRVDDVPGGPALTARAHQLTSRSMARSRAASPQTVRGAARSRAASPQTARSRARSRAASPQAPRDAACSRAPSPGRKAAVDATQEQPAAAGSSGAAGAAGGPAGNDGCGRGAASGVRASVDPAAAAASAHATQVAATGAGTAGSAGCPANTTGSALGNPSGPAAAAAPAYSQPITGPSDQVQVRAVLGTAPHQAAADNVQAVNTHFRASPCAQGPRPASAPSPSPLQSAGGDAVDAAGDGVSPERDAISNTALALMAPASADGSNSGRHAAADALAGGAAAEGCAPSAPDPTSGGGDGSGGAQALLPAAPRGRAVVPALGLLVQRTLRGPTSTRPAAPGVEGVDVGSYAPSPVPTTTTTTSEEGGAPEGPPQQQQASTGRGGELMAERSAPAVLHRWDQQQQGSGQFRRRNEALAQVFEAGDCMHELVTARRVWTPPRGVRGVPATQAPRVHASDVGRGTQRDGLPAVTPMRAPFPKWALKKDLQPLASLQDLGPDPDADAAAHPEQGACGDAEGLEAPAPNSQGQQQQEAAEDAQQPASLPPEADPRVAADVPDTELVAFLREQQHRRAWEATVGGDGQPEPAHAGATEGAAAQPGSALQPPAAGVGPLGSPLGSPMIAPRSPRLGVGPGSRPSSRCLSRMGSEKLQAMAAAAGSMPGTPRCATPSSLPRLHLTTTSHQPPAGPASGRSSPCGPAPCPQPHHHLPPVLPTPAEGPLPSPTALSPAAATMPCAQQPPAMSFRLRTTLQAEPSSPSGRWAGSPRSSCEGEPPAARPSSSCGHMTMSVGADGGVRITGEAGHRRSSSLFEDGDAVVRVHSYGATSLSAAAATAAAVHGPLPQAPSRWAVTQLAANHHPAGAPQQPGGSSRRTDASGGAGGEAALRASGSSQPHLPLLAMITDAAAAAPPSGGGLAAFAAAASPTAAAAAAANAAAGPAVQGPASQFNQLAPKGQGWAVSPSQVVSAQRASIYEELMAVPRLHAKHTASSSHAEVAAAAAGGPTSPLGCRTVRDGFPAAAGADAGAGGGCIGVGSPPPPPLAAEMSWADQLLQSVPAPPQIKTRMVLRKPAGMGMGMGTAAASSASSNLRLPTVAAAGAAAQSSLVPDPRNLHLPRYCTHASSGLALQTPAALSRALPQNHHSASGAALAALESVAAGEATTRSMLALPLITDRDRYGSPKLPRLAAGGGAGAAVRAYAAALQRSQSDAALVDF